MLWNIDLRLEKHSFETQLAGKIAPCLCTFRPNVKNSNINW